MASGKNPFADLKNQVKESKGTTKKKDVKKSVEVKEEHNIIDNTKSNTKHNSKDNTLTSTKNKTTVIQEEGAIVIPEKKSDEKVRRNFYVNKILDKELNKLAKKTGNSKSELVDIAIEFLVNNYRTV